MANYDKEFLLLEEALKFSEGELSRVCQTVTDKQLYNLLYSITQARNKILDAMMAHTMERKPTPLQWGAADKTEYVIKIIETELVNRIERNKKSSE